MILLEGTIIQRDTRAKEFRLYKEIEDLQKKLDEAYAKIDSLIEDMRGKDKRIDELTVILKAARKKTRSRKVWKTKEAEGIK